MFGARGRDRTFDLLIKSQLLYQLSYAGQGSKSIAPDGSRARVRGGQPRARGKGA